MLGDLFKVGAALFGANALAGGGPIIGGPQAGGILGLAAGSVRREQG